MLCKTVEASRRDPFVRLLSDWFVDEDRSPNSAATFQLFLLFHLYLYAHAFDSADLVVDVNAIAAQPEHRAAVEQRLSEWVLSPVDLSDARPAFGLSLFSVPSSAAFVDVIDQFVKQMIDESTSADAAQFVTRAKDEALAEWERHEFYSRTFRAFSLERLKLAEESFENRAALFPHSAAAEERPDPTDRSGDESDPKTAGRAKPKAKSGHPRAATAKRPSRAASKAKAKPAPRRGAPKRER